MIFRTSFHESTRSYSYLVALPPDGAASNRAGEARPALREAVLIDPVPEDIGGTLDRLERLGVQLRYTLETGAVQSSARAARLLRQAIGSSSVVPSDADCWGPHIRVGHRDELHLPGMRVDVLGHDRAVSSLVAYRVGDRLFSGALEVRRTPALSELPPETIVYSAYERRGTHISVVALENRPAPRALAAEALDGDPGGSVREGAAPGARAIG